MSQIHNVGPNIGQIEPQNEPVPQNAQQPTTGYVNPKLLGITDKLSKEELSNLSHSPSTVEKLANRKLEEFDEGVDTQRRLKTQILEARVVSGQMSKEDMRAELQRLETGWKEKRDTLAGKFSRQYEFAKANRGKLVATALGKLNENSLQTVIDKWEDFDRSLAAKYVKEKPQLNADGTKSTVWTRLTSKQGAITAGTLVTGVALGLLGTLGAPLLGATLSIGAVWGAAYCGISTLFGLGAIFAPSATKTAAALYEGVKVKRRVKTRARAA